MSRSKENAEALAQEASLTLHRDERAILKSILLKVLHDDDCFARLVSSDRSTSGRADDRLVLARFLERLEGQL